MAALLLGERIRARRITAVIVGFIGAIIVIQPSFEIFGWPALLPLGTAFFFALYMIITRVVAQVKTRLSLKSQCLLCAFDDHYLALLNDLTGL